MAGENGQHLLCVILLLFHSKYLYGFHGKAEESRRSRTVDGTPLPTSLPTRLLEDLQDLNFNDLSAKNMLHYEVVYPQKLDGTSFNEHPGASDSKRRKRAVGDASFGCAYKIHAYGKDYDILLDAESRRLRHWISVEYLKEGGGYQKKVVKSDCYKTGNAVEGNSSRMAALSDCGGLSGVIQIEQDFLYIEPLHEENTNTSYKTAHIIYKLSDIREYLNYTTDILNDYLPPKKEKKSTILNRKRRDTYDSFITFVNKANIEVQFFWVDYRGRKNYFLTLRKNEIRGVNTYDGTKWIAYDKSGRIRLFLNNKRDFTSRQNDESDRLKVYVSAPVGVVLPTDDHENAVTGDQKYIEVMVVVDYSVTRHHGRRKVEKYVLTFMNVVSRIFQDPSLGVNLNFVVTRLVILERREPALKIINRSPSASVTSACNFAVSLQKGSDDHKAHFDFALTLTRRKFGPSGYAPVYSMCTRTRSCALVEDDGLTSAFIAAHETGHTLGLGHDGQAENDCEHDGSRGSVMSALVVSRFDKFFWSKCSRNTIRENIEYFRCLNDQPQAASLPYSLLFAGTYFTLDEQCESTFGKGYTRCNAFSHDPCRLLWCNIPGKNYYCKTLRGPALDGTTCGMDKWCRRGACVPSTLAIPLPTKPLPTTVPPIHGNWSKWSRWSICSTSCGVGIKFRQRQCDNPKPQNGGRPCTGLDKETSLCDQDACLISKTFDDIREEQCRQFGGKNWRLYRDNLLQRLLNSKRHSLNCTFEGGMCNWVNSKDDKFNWKLNKGKTPSSGTGPDFDHTKKNRKGQYLFIEASDDYRERRRNHDNAKLVSAFITAPRTCLRFYYHMYGKDMGELKVYVRIKGKETKEVFREKGNRGNKWLLGEISLEFLQAYRVIIEAVRGRHYTGDIAIDDITHTIGLCDDKKKARSNCAISCRSPGAKRFLLDKHVLDGTKCYSNSSEDICIAGKCMSFGCDKKFGSRKIVDQCGVCGGDGSTCQKVKGFKDIVPRREFEVVLILMPGAINLKVEDVKRSPYQLGIKKKNGNGVFLKDYHGAATGYYRVAGTTFRYSHFKKHKSLLALDPIQEELEVVLYASNYHRRTGKSAKIRYQYYKTHSKIPTYKYIGEFGPCSKSCGIGKLVTQLRCLRESDEKILPNKYCSHLPKPVRFQKVCNLKRCPTEYKWIKMAWGKCSATCNGGFRSRVIACMKIKGSQLAPNNRCPPPAPSNRQECNKSPCDIYRWSVGKWQRCSKSCDGGVKRRNVFCKGIRRNEKVHPKLCTGLRPRDREPCNIFLCDVFEWYTHKFGQCTKTCGGGQRIRLVYCTVKATKARASSELCTGPSPLRIGTCNNHPCPEIIWKVGNYSDCSRKCGNGTRTRTVHCIHSNSGRVTNETNCKSNKPTASIPCYNGPCSRYVWELGPWSACNVECGKGTKRRSSKCIDTNTSKTIDRKFCYAIGPTVSKTCTMSACAKPSDLNCNFDGKTRFGKWQNSGDDDFDWSIGGSTPTTVTGPKADHTTGKSTGRFAYIEASSPRTYADKATLFSPYMDRLQGCLRFWYHMRGYGMGSLMVRLVSRGGKTTIFTKTGHKGREWKKAEISFKRTFSTVPYKITITAYRGRSYASDISIDDISVTGFACGKKIERIPPVRKCIEISPLCALTQSGDYCKYRAFRQLCCKSCSAKPRP